MSDIKNKIKFFESLNCKKTLEKNKSKQTKKLNSEISYWNNIKNNTKIQSKDNLQVNKLDVTNNNADLIKTQVDSIKTEVNLKKTPIDSKKNNINLIKTDLNEKKINNKECDDESELLYINNIIN
jgi:hypothetical protein